MSIIQYKAGQTSSLRSSREVARMAEATEVAVAHVLATVTVETATLDARHQVAGRAMQGVALVSQLEQQLAQVVPIAAGRLQAIGDMHALATAQVVAETPRRLR